ncbi:MAG: hypothetical protein U0R72_09365 [Nakamurella multipartita]
MADMLSRSEKCAGRSDRSAMITGLVRADVLDVVHRTGFDVVHLVRG